MNATPRELLTRASGAARKLALAVLVCAPLALVALPARDLAHERARVDALRADLAARRSGAPSAEDLAQLDAGLAALETRLDAHGESGLAERVLAEVFARDAGVELAQIDAATDDAGAFEIRGSATVSAWSSWIGALAAHGLAPRVAEFRLARRDAEATRFDGTFTLTFAHAAGEVTR